MRNHCTEVRGELHGLTYFFGSILAACYRNNLGRGETQEWGLFFALQKILSHWSARFGVCSIYYRCVPSLEFVSVAWMFHPVAE